MLRRYKLQKHYVPGLEQLRVQVDCTGGGFKGQLKRADKSGADYALLIGEEELAQGVVTVKPLRGGAEQARVEHRWFAGTFSKFNESLDYGVFSGNLSYGR